MRSSRQWTTAPLVCGAPVPPTIWLQRLRSPPLLHRESWDGDGHAAGQATRSAGSLTADRILSRRALLASLWHSAALASRRHTLGWTPRSGAERSCLRHRPDRARRRSTCLLQVPTCRAPADGSVPALHGHYLRAPAMASSGRMTTLLDEADVSRESRSTNL